MSNPKKETFEEGYKRCGTCNEIKPLLDFIKTKDGYRGVAGTCKICTSIKAKQYQQHMLVPGILLRFQVQMLF